MRWGQWVSRYSIKLKLIVVLLSAILSSIALTGAFSQYFYTKAAKQDFFQFADDASYRLNRQIDQYFMQLKISVSSMVAGPLPNRNDITRSSEHVGIIQSWLASSGPTSLSRLADLQDVLNNYVALNYDEIDSMFLVAADGRAVSNLQSLNRAGDVYKNEMWFKTELGENLQVLPTHRSEQTGRNVISLVLPIFSTDTMKLAGRLVLNLRIGELEKTLVRSTLAGKGYFFIVARDGTIVYHPEPGLLGQPIGETSLAELKLDHPSDVQTIQGTEMLISSNDSELADWKLVAMVPFEEMASGVKVARNAVMASVLILVVIVLITVPIIAQRFTRPLRQLKKLMEQVEQGNLDVRADVVPGRDEIQLLSHSYNRMTSRLHSLIETVSRMKVNEMNILLGQKEAMIRALQNQINPHLLYNTLEIINSLAYVEKNERIQVIAKNLGDYYRYTASIKEPFVPLREELEHARKYLDIVKIRFPKHFQSRFYVNEKYMEAGIVKCSLQPLVENAVKYAIEPRQGNGTIIVSAYNESEDLIIEVADNGDGIAPDRLEELRGRLSSMAAQTDETLMGSPSLGIANVHARLVLQYGPRYGLTLTSFEGRGTVVSIRVPMQPNGPPEGWSGT
ncbi:sensor histidine kinase [Paenibacillus sp. PAMC21692]|uniref:cache domain-containing sensor histidine kinase n=1 Tax=Paenibacillus sp. PAMC21692 TaxID=2762320 RepID=UPI00164E16C0|nr:sensor histidine kinase [Paenibacillus sp. PAMC21692]QNK58320.1 sensor histidine kinase [Paenibacillus sp. PAMC21692]